MQACEKILAKLTKSRKGLDKSIKKIANRIFQLKYQVSIDTWQEEQSQSEAK